MSAVIGQRIAHFLAHAQNEAGACDACGNDRSGGEAGESGDHCQFRGERP
jgi:hypothetical protein